MPVDPTRKPSPAAKAANAARILGVVLVAFAVLGSMATNPSTSARPGRAPHPPWLVAAVYGVPGIVLVLLSLLVRRRSIVATGVTLAVSVLAALLTCFVAVQAIRMAIAPIVPNFGVIGLCGILSLSFGLLAVYCVQSLCKPLDPPRGFEPLFAAMPAMTEHDAGPIA